MSTIAITYGTYSVGYQISVLQALVLFCILPMHAFEEPGAAEHGLRIREKFMSIVSCVVIGSFLFR